MIKLKEKILDDITKTQGSFETISQDIAKLETMMSDAQKRGNKDVTKTKAYPTPKEIEVVTPTPKEQGSVQEPAVQAPAVKHKQSKHQRHKHKRQHKQNKKRKKKETRY